MTLRLVGLALLGISALLPAADNGLQVITLKDNSVIRARVTEMSGGFYSASSPTLGDMKIPTSEVVSIHNETTAVQSAGAPAPVFQKTGAAQPEPASGAIGLDSLRSALSSKVQGFVSSRDGMNAVMDFSRRPDVKAIMNDPQVMKAIQSGDYTALMQSPAMKNLLDNPQTKNLIQSILGSNSQDAQHPKTSSGEPVTPAE